MKFEELIEKSVEDFLRRGSGQKREIGTYYPSEMWNCIRKLWLMYKEPKQFDIETLKVFESGNMVHDFFRNVLFKSFIDSEAITKFDYEGSLVYNGEGFEIRGRFDDLLHLRFNNKPILIEVKTVRDLRFFKGLSEHHNLQFQYYINMIKVPDLGAYIIYIDRGNLNMRIFEVKKDEKPFMQMIERTKKLHTYLTADEVPLPEGKIIKDRNWFCSYCDYKSLCGRIGSKKTYEVNKDG